MAYTPNWIDNGPTYVQPTLRGNSIVYPNRNIARIGSNLYVLCCQIGLSSYTAVMMYKSVDGGLTWARQATCPFTVTGSGSYLIDMQEVSGKLYVFFMGTSGTTTYLSIYDPAGEPSSPWGSVVTMENLGGSGYADQYYFGVQPSGDFWLIYGFDHADGLFDTRVDKSADGGLTWTRIATFVDSGTIDHSYNFRAATMASDGTIHAFVNTSIDDNNTTDLSHFSISSSGVVSSIHLIDTGIETGGFTPSRYVISSPSISPTTGELSYGYAVGVQTSYGGRTPPYTGELRVVRGDTSVTPLSPTWTIASISTTIYPDADHSIIPNNVDAPPMVRTVYDAAGALTVYFQSKYPVNDPAATQPDANGSGVIFGPNRLFSSQYNSGSWATPTVFFDQNVAGSTPAGTYLPLDSFDVLRLTSGVGVLVSVQDFDSAFPHGLYLGYGTVGGSKSLSYAFTGYLHSF